ncbi:Outer membrane lipoprotein-sorting protein [Halorientalis persicus]|jgi:outer membrane lipoprotein-sorting protein|uniref:Outer membrane lipoprotein-sorting protein n=1 Tax=Halorientalis persicus TaxID=1367881 RepID=A0A1H8KJ23_9EURY|nr:outer membrane lipoprotein carrier protein LolA [Halorientalis persicus]SEN92963.1 Outer membrane lipoprotein-sorting protein [Halorientalis persicus]
MSRGTVTAKQILGGICLLALVGGVLAVGFLSSDSPDRPEPRQIGANASDRYAAVDGINATRTTINRDGDEVNRSIHRVSMRPGTDQFRERLQYGPQHRHDLTVSNGSMMWWQNRTSGAVERLDLSTPDVSVQRTEGERIERLFDRLNVTDGTDRTAATPTPGINPLPAVPQSGDVPAGQTGERPNGVGNAAFAVSYNGTETIDGRSVYVLKITPRNGSLVGDFRQTLWVDTEWFVPLKRHSEWHSNGVQHAKTVVYENVTFNPGLDDSVFRFDPSANVTVKLEDTPRRDFYSSTAALRRVTNVSVPTPDLPPSFQLQFASKTESPRITSVGQKYVNASTEISVSKVEGYFYPPTPDRSTRVAGQQANVSVGYTTYVSWSCGGYDYQVSGKAVSPKLLIEIARSVGCE